MNLSICCKILKLFIFCITYAKSNPVPENPNLYPDCPLSQLAYRNSLPKKGEIIDEDMFATCGAPTTAYKYPSLIVARNGLTTNETTGQRWKWPWMAYVYNLTNCEMTCAGTLLSHKWAISAASCFEKGYTTPNQYGVALGGFLSTNVHRLVRLVLMHPGYLKRSRGKADNVAMIELTKPIQFTSDVRPACLPPYGADTDNRNPNSFFSFEGRSCTLLGWKKIFNNNTNSFGRFVQQQSLTILTDVQCRNETGLTATNNVQLCAGGRRGEEACETDAGAPLLCQHSDGNYYVHGVATSTGLACENNNTPCIFTATGYPDINIWISAVLLRS